MRFSENADSRFRAIVESLGEGIAILSPDGSIEYANPGLARILGLSAEEITGYRLESRVVPEDRAALASLLGELCPRDPVGLRVLLPGGGDRCVLAARLPGGPGELGGAGIVLKDGSETEAVADRALRLSKVYATHRAVVRAIVRMTDRRSLFADCCKAACEVGDFRLAWVGSIDPDSSRVEAMTAFGATGYLDGIRISTKDEPEGRGPTGIAVREGRYFVCNDFLGSEVTKPWHDRACRYGIRSSASIVLRQAGEARWALTLYSGEKDFFDEEHVELLKEMGDDLSLGLDLLRNRELRGEAETGLRAEAVAHEQTMRALREKEQTLIDQGRQAAMGAMIGNIAHQWRQPLACLALAVQKPMLYYDQGKLDRPALQRAVDQCMGLITHMSQTIDDFRDFFKPNREKVSFSARETISKSLGLLREAFEEAGIAVSIEACEDPTLHGYPGEFSHAVINLLLNARDALAERKVADPRIVVRLGSEDGRAIVSVADNAGGIPKEVLDRIFEPYFTTKDESSGTGLGLWMSRTIIQRNMRGQLKAANAGEGAEFRIELPLG